MSEIKNMTLAEITRNVNMMRSNGFSDYDKLVWINEIEGIVQTEIMGIDPADIVQYSDANVICYTLVPRPYSRLYALYVVAMIDLANGEYEKYNMSSAAFNEAMQSYAKWYIRNRKK